MIDTPLWDKRIEQRIKIDKQKYYGGFAVGRDRSIFKEELEQLEKIYQEIIDNSMKELDIISPPLISFMKRFIEHYETIESFGDKLDELKYKRKGDEDDEEED